MCKPDSAYPCYGHDCYERGNYHASCPSCPFYKTVISEKNKNAKNLTDTEWRRRIFDDLNTQYQKDNTEELIEMDRSIKSGDPNPNTGIVYSNLDEKITEYLGEIGPLPVVVDKGNIIVDFMVARYDEIIGSIVAFTDTTVMIRLTSYGASLRDRGFLDNTTIQFCYMADPDTQEVIRVFKAALESRKGKESDE